MMRVIGFTLLFVFILTLALACAPAQQASNATATAAAATISYLETQLTPVSGGPKVAITAPLAGQRFEWGQRIEVQIEAVDSQGISQVDLLADNRVVSSSPLVPQPGSVLVSKINWQPDAPGSYALHVRAYNPAGAVGESDKIVIQVGSTPTATATSTPTPTFTPTPQRTPTTRLGDLLPSPQPTETPTPAGTPTPDYPYLVVQITGGLNIRRGPGTQYETLGVLPPGQMAEIIGQNNSGAGPWWQIWFPPGPNGVGWVSANPTYATSFNAQNVPIVAAPTTAAPSTPTNTPTSPAPPPAQQTDITFGADRTQIKSGECVTIYWNAVNVKEVYYRNQGVPGNNQGRTECPSFTEIYELRVVRLDGQVETRTIRIEVEGSGYRTSEIDLGKGIDFDEDGKVSDKGDDFKWVKDGDDYKIQKWDDDGDLRLVPIGPVELDIVSEADCHYALNNINDRDSMRPFPGLAACFRTDEGRIGKMRFDDVDNDADIQWVLWK